MKNIKKFTQKVNKQVFEQCKLLSRKTGRDIVFVSYVQSITRRKVISVLEWKKQLQVAKYTTNLPNTVHRPKYHFWRKLNISNANSFEKT